MAAQWGQFLAGIDPTAGEFRRQQAFVEEQKSRKLDRIIAEMKMEEYQNQIERREKFRTTLKDIGDRYASQSRSGTSNTMPTKEFINGQWVTVNDSFRGYASPQASSSDYAAFLGENPRYGAYLQAGDMNTALAELQKSGYATDPNYASKVANINPRTPEQAQFLEARKQELINAGLDPIRAEIGARQSAIETGWGRSLSGGNNYYGVKSHGKTSSSPEEAQAKEALVNELGYPPELVDGASTAINDANEASPEIARQNLQMLAFEFPEFAAEQQSALAAIEDMSNAKYRKKANEIRDDILKSIENEEPFDERMEQRIIGLSIMSGDVSPLMDYFKSKREGTDSLAKYDKPSDVFTDQRIESLAKSIDANPADFGFDPDEWHSKDVGERLAIAQDIAAQAQEDYVGGQWANQGWKRGVSELNAFRETALRRAGLTLGDQEIEPQTLQEPIQSGQVINWSDM